MGSYPVRGSSIRNGRGLRSLAMSSSLQCSVLLLDLLLAIRRQGEHSCDVAIPDRFIDVDDVDSPGQRR
jgi:hypothetical protein